MKKYIISVIMLLSSLCYSENIRLASFNVMKLGESPKDYNALSKIISKFDIIALEEVINEKGLVYLIDKLGSSYDYVISEAVGTRKYKEHYAVVYKKSKVDRIYNVGKYEEKDREFIREPSAFYVKSNKLDMLLIPVHSIYGKNSRERAYEASKYIDVYKYFEEKTGQDDIIIMGDFNLSANDKSFDNLRENGFSNILNPLEDKTTMSKTRLANPYDNIFIKLGNTKAFTYRYGVYDFTKNNYEQVRKYLSDHLLIFIELNNEVD